MLRASLLILFFLVFLGACLTPDPRARLLAHVQEYNNAVRWGRSERAEPLVEEGKRQEFLRWWEEWNRTVEIQEWHLKEIRFPAPDRAEVELERVGYRKDELRERRFGVHQIWKRLEDRWVLEEGF